MARMAVRQVTLVLAVLGLALVAGCVGDEQVTASGTEATFDAGEYEHLETVERSVEEQITVVLQGDIEGRESADVSATVPVATYERGSPPTIVAVASSPYVQVIDNPPKGGDPLSERSPAGVAAIVQDTYAEVSDLDAVESRPVTLLGNESELTTYEGTATRDGESVDVRVDLVRARHDGDVVTVVVVRPASAEPPDAELFEAVSH